MPRKPSTPKYTNHKATGQARVRLGGHDVYLGKFDSPESHEKYRRVVAEYLTARAIPAGKDRRPAPLDLSMNELILRFIKWAEGYYVKNGKPTSEMGIVRVTMRFLKEHYGRTPANEFSPLKLKALREEFVRHGYCRRECNRRAQLIARMYRWAVENELVPAHIHAELKAVACLPKGRTIAKDYPPIGCVSEEHFQAALPFMPASTRDILRFMSLTGCRPSEACAMRPLDIDRSDPVWAYKPGSHKTEHHERDRVILIGPQAQAILAPYLEYRKPELTVFDPRELDGPVKGGVVRKKGCRYRDHLGRTIRGVTYFTAMYLENAVGRACRKANIPAWTPNQLRHVVATKVQSQYSLDAARAILGHSNAQMTTRYAAHDLKAASEIMGAIG